MDHVETIDLTPSPEEYANLFRFFYKNLIDDVKRPRKDAARGFVASMADIYRYLSVERPILAATLLAELRTAANL